jgi:hypothetical protein
MSVSAPGSLDAELKYLSDVAQREAELKRLNEEIVSVHWVLLKTCCPEGGGFGGALGSNLGMLLIVFREIRCKATSLTPSITPFRRNNHPLPGHGVEFVGGGQGRQGRFLGKEGCAREEALS